MGNSKKNQEFAQRLNELLKKNNITQSELAKRMGIAKSSVNGWCKGTAYPRMDKMSELSSILNVDIFTLVSGEKPYIISVDAEKFAQAMEIKEKQAKTYYFDEKTAQTAQEIFENKQLSLLFDAAKDASPEDLETVHTMLLALKNKDKKTE